jgi:hypothetical protein
MNVFIKREWDNSVKHIVDWNGWMGRSSYLQIWRIEGTKSTHDIPCLNDLYKIMDMRMTQHLDKEEKLAKEEKTYTAN